MTTYELQDEHGHVISSHDSYDDAVTAAEEFAGSDGIVGHDGDLSEHGDRERITLLITDHFRKD